MGRFFNLDSPFVAFMNRVADLMILNVLFVICCIPVITIGPALTALYYVTLKMARNEESYIAKSYFKSFKLNFKQGLLMWLIDLVLIGIFALDFTVLNGKIPGIENPGTPAFTVVRVILMVLAFLMLFTFSFTFPVLAKFDNTIKNTYRNAFLMSIRHFPTALVTVMLWGAVIILGYLLPQTIIAHLLILFSLAAFISSFLFVRAFDNYIPKEEEEDGSEAEAEAAESLEAEAAITEVDENM